MHCDSLLGFEIAIEPALHVAQTGDTAIGATAARETVRLVRETDHLRLHAQLLQRDEDLLALLDGAAEVVLAVDDEGRRCGVTDIADG
jgi:hypothetical protein